LKKFAEAVVIALVALQLSGGAVEMMHWFW
jgi:hypothetical protein